MIPIAFIAASLRAALSDLDEAYAFDDVDRFVAAHEQAHAVVDELELHDGARERSAANDVTATGE